MKKLIFAFISAVLLVSCASNEGQLFLEQKLDALDQENEKLIQLEDDWYANLKETNLRSQNAINIQKEYYEICRKYHYQRNDLVNFLNNNPGAIDVLSTEQLSYVSDISVMIYENCINNVNMMRDTINAMRGLIYQPVSMGSLVILE